MKIPRILLAAGASGSGKIDYLRPSAGAGQQKNESGFF